jgi:hypothetical protein
LVRDYAAAAVRASTPFHVLVAAVALALTGCGGSGGEETSGPTESEVTDKLDSYLPDEAQVSSCVHLDGREYDCQVLVGGSDGSA